jgi:glycerol transport system ATP-binding protein
MIYVTHDQTEALTFADQVVVMNNGRAVQIGTPSDLFEKPTHTFVGYFIGSPGMNFLEGRITGRTIAVNGFEIALGAAYPSLAPNTAVKLGIRPDYALLTASGGLPVTVRRIDDLGRRRIAHVSLGDQSMVAFVPNDLSLDGSRAQVKFDPARTHIYLDDELVEAVSLTGGSTGFTERRAQ